jgi:membrane protease YdiL (CAAX protease family)
VAEPEAIVEPAEVAAGPVRVMPTPPAWVSILEVILCSGFPSQLALSLLLVLAGLSATAGDRLSFPFVVALSTLDTVVILGLVALFLKARGESLRATLLGARPVRPEVWRGLALVPLVFALVMVGALVIERLAPHLRNVESNPLQAMLDSPTRLAVFAVVVVVAGGVREEIQRAFILHRFERDLGGVWVGLLLFSVAFGLGHTMQGYDAAILTGVLGLVWGLVFLARRSVVAPIVSHALFNLGELGIFYYASRAGLIGT